MLWLRILSALIGIPLLISIIFLGNIWLGIGLFFVIGLGTYEFKNILEKKGYKPLILPVLIGNVVFIFGVINNWNYWFSLGTCIALLIISFIVIIKYPELGIKDIAGSILMFVYVGWTLIHILLLSSLNQGSYLLLFLFVVIWITDTGAYFSGRFLGKNKLAPQISPNKTIEGALGGLLASILFANIFNYFVPLFPFWILNIIAIIISITGQLGDLLESSFKRFAGIKDSGNIIPGHGGILDRFDSIILSAPVYYYMLLFF